MFQSLLQVPIPWSRRIRRSATLAALVAAGLLAGCASSPSGSGKGGAPGGHPWLGYKFHSLDFQTKEETVDGVVESSKTRATVNMIFRNRLNKPLTIRPSSIFLVGADNNILKLTSGSVKLSPYGTHMVGFSTAELPTASFRGPYTAQFHTLLSKETEVYAPMDLVVTAPLSILFTGGMPEGSAKQVSQSYNFAVSPIYGKPKRPTAGSTSPRLASTN